MRPLTDDETKDFFRKLSNFIGENVKILLDRPDGTFCFRLHKDRVYYVNEELMKRSASCFPRKKLICFGTIFGRFNKNGKFKLNITALDFLAPYAKNKVWLKQGSETQFLHGQHVIKSALGRITDNTIQNNGVVVYSMNDTPLGFGVAAKSTQQCRHTDPAGIVVIHQADIGEYIRNEDALT